MFIVKQPSIYTMNINFWLIIMYSKLFVSYIARVGYLLFTILVTIDVLFPSVDRGCNYIYSFRILVECRPVLDYLRSINCLLISRDISFFGMRPQSLINVILVRGCTMPCVCSPSSSVRMQFAYSRVQSIPPACSRATSHVNGRPSSSSSCSGVGSVTPPPNS